MDVFLGKACYAEDPINTLLMKTSGYAAGFELCHQVNNISVACYSPPETNFVQVGYYDYSELCNQAICEAAQGW